MIKRIVGICCCALIGCQLLIADEVVSSSESVRYSEIEYCPMDAYLDLLNQDFSSSEIMEVNVDGFTVEGGSAEIYRQAGKVVLIRLGLFGESFHRKMNYYFDPLNDRRYLVDVDITVYTTLFDSPDSGLKSFTNSKFSVCDDLLPSFYYDEVGDENGELYYDGGELFVAGREYDKAIYFLEIIRKNQL